MKVVKYDIRRNKRGRHIVFEVPDKGRWKIKKNFANKKDAEDWVEDHTPKKKKSKKKKPKKQKRR